MPDGGASAVKLKDEDFSLDGGQNVTLGLREQLSDKGLAKARRTRRSKKKTMNTFVHKGEPRIRTGLRRPCKLLMGEGHIATICSGQDGMHACA